MEKANAVRTKCTVCVSPFLAFLNGKDDEKYRKQAIEHYWGFLARLKVGLLMFCKEKACFFIFRFCVEIQRAGELHNCF